MSRLANRFLFTAIAGTVLILTACVVTPHNPNYNPGQGYDGQAAPVDVSDLRGGAANHAKQQLRARGFTQVGQSQTGRFHNTWWANSATNQCFQLEATGGQVMTLNSASPSQCAASASQSPNPLTRNAETACRSAISSQYGGIVNQVKVVRAEFSEANTEVIIDAVGVRGGPTTERWRCLASNGGQVADLSMIH
jgi:hypothetical protein